MQGSLLGQMQGTCSLERKAVDGILLVDAWSAASPAYAARSFHRWGWFHQFMSISRSSFHPGAGLTHETSEGFSTLRV